MNEEKLKSILAAMIQDVFKEECHELMLALDKIICSVIEIMDTQGYPYRYEESISALCSVLPLIYLGRDE